MTSPSHHRRRRSRSRRPTVCRQKVRRAALPPEPVRVTVEQQATVALVRITGEFDLAAVPVVERALARSVDRLTDEVVFDLRGVSFLDLCGLRTILRADERARRESYCVEVVPPLGLARRIFTLTAAHRQLTLVEQPPG